VPERAELLGVAFQLGWHESISNKFELGRKL
jgi:hypothetical protein